MRNAGVTKEKILDAAMAEFSAYGIAGARVDRIAATAGCNKNLIYVYFENKESLFITVLKKNLAYVYDKMPVLTENLPGYAADLFDFSMANPQLMRLLAWANLEKQSSIYLERADSITQKLGELAKAQRAGIASDRLSPASLLTLILTIATAWSAANPFGQLINPIAQDGRDNLRQTVASAIGSLIASSPPPS